MDHLLYRLFVIAVAFMATACNGNAHPSNLPTGTVTITGTNGANAEVHVEVVSTEAQREQGLMFRSSLDEDRGMLFLFPGNETIGFWMKDTYVALDIAYIGADGTVQEVRQAKPLDETVLVPKSAYRFVLEVNQGWFERHGLGVGAKVTLPKDLPKAS